MGLSALTWAAPSAVTNDANRRLLTDDLKAEASRLGFDVCGVSRARRLDEQADRLESWLTEGRNGSMAWMERNFEKRVDPRRLVDGAQSIVSVLHSYYRPDPRPSDPAVGKVSRYAWGDDYHDVLKDKLFALFNWLGERTNGCGGRAFVDSAPVLDKAWAQQAGLGWMGKHSNLLTRDKGSFFFIGELIVDVALDADEPFTADHCGTCTRCIDACPTDAIYQPYAVDARRCISYQTIENKTSAIPDDLGDDFENWIFGCDICQDVCPWNKFKRVTTEPRFAPREGMVDTYLERWAELDLEAFARRFKNSPIKRAKLGGFLRNVEVALHNAERLKGG